MARADRVCSACRGSGPARAALLAEARRVCAGCGGEDADRSRSRAGKRLRWMVNHGTLAGLRALLASEPPLCDRCFVLRRRADREALEAVRREGLRRFQEAGGIDAVATRPVDIPVMSKKFEEAAIRAAAVRISRRFDWR